MFQAILDAINLGVLGQHIDGEGFLIGLLDRSRFQKCLLFTLKALRSYLQAFA